MDVITLDQIIDYATCPLKLKIDGMDEERYTAEELFELASRKAVYAYFHSIAQGSMESKATKNALQKFDSVWLSNHDKISEGFKSTGYSGHFMLSRVKEVYNPKKDTVASVNVEMSLAMKDYILKDNIDLVLINYDKSTNKTLYRAIQFYGASPNANERYLELKATFFKSAFQKYLDPKVKRNYSYELRPFRGKDKDVIFKYNHRHIMNIICNNVYKSIKGNIWFPTTSKESCKECRNKKICQMNLLKTNR